MSYDNYIVKVEIVFSIKKIEILGPITFRDYGTS